MKTTALESSSATKACFLRVWYDWVGTRYIKTVRKTFPNLTPYSGLLWSILSSHSSTILSFLLSKIVHEQSKGVTINLLFIDGRRNELQNTDKLHKMDRDICGYSLFFFQWANALTAGNDYRNGVVFHRVWNSVKWIWISSLAIAVNFSERLVFFLYWRLINKTINQNNFSF